MDTIEEKRKLILWIQRAIWMHDNRTTVYSDYISPKEKEGLDRNDFNLNYLLHFSHILLAYIPRHTSFSDNSSKTFPDIKSTSNTIEWKAQLFFLWINTWLNFQWQNKGFFVKFYSVSLLSGIYPGGTVFEATRTPHNHWTWA